MHVLPVHSFSRKSRVKETYKFKGDESNEEKNPRRAEIEFPSFSFQFHWGVN